MHTLPPPARKGNDIALKRSNVIAFHRNPPVIDPARAFDSFTHALVLQKHREGTLPEAVVAALLAGVGIGIEP